MEGERRVVCLFLQLRGSVLTEGLVLTLGWPCGRKMEESAEERSGFWAEAALPWQN